MRFGLFVALALSSISAGAISAAQPNSRVPVPIPDSCTLTPAASKPENAIVPIADLGVLETEPEFIAGQNRVQGQRRDRRAISWDAASGAQTSALDPRPEWGFQLDARSPDGRFEVWGEGDVRGQVFLWDSRTNKRVA